MTLSIASGTTPDEVAVAPSRSWLVLVAGRRPPLPKNVQLTSLPREPMSAPQVNCPFAHASLAVVPVQELRPAPAKDEVADTNIAPIKVDAVVPVAVR